MQIRQDCEPIFDVPQAYHREEFLNEVTCLIGGMPVRRPLYDLNSNRRLLQTEMISPADMIIAEGLFAASFLDSSDLAALHVYMDTPLDECLR
jgi:uridine kinase